MDDKLKNTDEGDKLAIEGDAAFKKYNEKESSLTLLKDPVYQNGPINLYSSFYTSGYADYTATKWSAALGKLKKAVEYSDLMIEHKLLTAPLDTNVLILAGITAENSGMKNDAMKYYGRLADHKIGGEGFESVYRFLVTNYFQNKDYTAFEKYKALSEEVFPASGYFKFDKVDFAVGLVSDFSSKQKALEELLLNDPNDYKANEVLGELIYDTLNPKDDQAALPANADVLEKKMVAAFKKVAAAKPGFENPFIYVGDHFINKAVPVNRELQAQEKAIDDKTKAGGVVSKADIAKKTALYSKYGGFLQQAGEPYEKAAQIFSQKSSLTSVDKKQYKKVVSYLIDIASFRKSQNKNNPAGADKYAAEEKKWNDLWESIK